MMGTSNRLICCWRGCWRGCVLNAKLPYNYALNKAFLKHHMTPAEPVIQGMCVECEKELRMLLCGADTFPLNDLFSLSCRADGTVEHKHHFYFFIKESLHTVILAWI